MTTPRNTAKAITLIGTDSNPGGPFTFTVISRPARGSLTTAGELVTYTPDTDYTGVDSFQYTVTDTNGTSLPAVVTINVLPLSN